MPALRPDWPAPPGVHAAVTRRDGGVSAPPYASLNLGAHVGDAAAAVAENRRRVRSELALPAEPLWLTQVHGVAVLDADRTVAQASPPRADAAVTRVPGRVLAVLVADCMPVLLARRDGSAIAIAHAGWRGLAAGVLENAVGALSSDPAALQAWLGPAISPKHFEVETPVRDAFCAHSPAAESAFVANARARWQCDLYALARQRLCACGVSAVFGQARCTFAHETEFFSHRRDRVSGRMAALLWMGAR